MRKALFILGTLLALLACEAAKTWEVTVTTVTERWNAIQYFKISESTSVTKETKVDWTEKEIIEYCKPSGYSETYGTTMYKYRTTKTYKEVE